MDNSAARPEQPWPEPLVIGGPDEGKVYYWAGPAAAAWASASWVDQDKKPLPNWPGVCGEVEWVPEHEERA
jgi:hypothetical protein